LIGTKAAFIPTDDARNSCQTLNGNGLPSDPCQAASNCRLAPQQQLFTGEIMAITSLPTVLTPTLNMQARMHKHGVHGSTQDQSAGHATAQAPTGSTHGMFSSILDSVERLIGVKPAAAAAPERKA
jgi:hypothetical protein